MRIHRFPLLLIGACVRGFKGPWLQEVQHDQHACLIASRLFCQTTHTVDNLQCTEICVDFPNHFTVKILEADSAAQERLVNVALETLAEGADADPYGAVLWPSARTVSSRLLEMNLKDMTVLELGTGTGLVALVCALHGAKRVIATDYNRFALALVDEARSLQAKPISSSLLETAFFDVKDVKVSLPQAELLVVADLLYEPATGVAIARRVFEQVSRGGKVILGDSPGRPGRPHFLAELRSLLGREVDFVSTKGQTVCGVRHELISGSNSPPNSRPSELDMALLEL